MAENRQKKWWAWQGLNLRPLRCQHSEIEHKRQNSDSSHAGKAGTAREHSSIRGVFYRSFTAPQGACS